MSLVNDIFNTALGGPKTSTTTVTETPEKPGTNYGMIIGGVVLAVGVIILVWWLVKKPKAVKAA